MAHVALRAILASYVGRLPHTLTFELSAHGKPSLSYASCGDTTGLTFNLSHSGELALVGVTCRRRLGVDIERIRPELAEGAIAERFFSPAEVRDLNELAGAERVCGFFRCWTRKEAFVKARGEGLSLPLDSFGVALRADQPPAICWTTGDPDEAGRWSVISVAAHADYEAAAVVEGAVPTVRTWQFVKKS